MSRFEIKMPKLGESITEGTILSWSVKVGDTVQEDQVLFEVNTAKVSAEIPSPVAGKVVEILYKEGDTVPVGTVVAVIDLEGDSDGEENLKETSGGMESSGGTGTSGGTESSRRTESSGGTGAPGENETSGNGGTEATGSKEVGASSAKGVEASGTDTPSSSSQEKEMPKAMAARTEGDRWYSPVVLQLAQAAHISKEELDTIPGTGYEGRLSKKDIKNYIAKKEKGSAGELKAKPKTEPKNESKQASGNREASAPKTASSASSATESDVEVKEMDRVRKMIADHMVMSKHTSPHVTNVVEADVTRLVKWRAKNKDAFFRREGVKLTYMPVIAEAVAKALAAYPQVNVSVDGYNILQKKHINIGIAVSLDDGNLIVPVVRDANRLNLSGLAVAIDSLAAKARDNKLSPDDISGGTFTITNFGTFKSLFGTPIINQPQVAILGVGYIEKKPAVVETPEGDTIAIRHKMYLSLSYDHRVVDGMLGGQFLYAIKEYLENWKE